MKQSTLFKVLLLGLPVGLVVTSGGSLLYHFNKNDQKVAPQEKHAAPSFQRKAVSESDLRLFVTRLAEDVGPRHPSNERALSKTLSFLEGLLGPNNFGYKDATRRVVANAPEKTRIQVEITGKRRPGEVVMLSTSYLSDPLSPGAHANASGVAVLLSLAQALVGTEPERTLRLVFLPQPLTAQLGDDKAALALAEASKGEGNTVVAHLHLCALGAAPASVVPAEAALSFVDNQFTSESTVKRARVEAQFAENAALKVATASSSPYQFLGDTLAAQQVPCLLVTDAVNPGSPPPAGMLDTPAQINFPVLTEIVRGLQRVVEIQLSPSKFQTLD